MKRIAITGISIECLERSSVRASYEDFDIHRGEQLFDQGLSFIPGMLDRLKTEADVQICPLMWASALPNGLVEANAYARLKGEMLARLEAEGPFDGVTATFHTRRVGLTIRQQFHQLGIDPQAHAVYVVKLGYLFPELAEIAGRIILLLSPGVAGLDFPSQKWVRVPRPIYPLDAGMTWDIG